MFFELITYYVYSTYFYLKLIKIRCSVYEKILDRMYIVYAPDKNAIVDKKKTLFSFSHLAL